MLFVQGQMTTGEWTITEKACRFLNIVHKQIIEWKKQLEMFKDCNNKKVMSLHKGKDSLLIDNTDTLISFIFKLRETGMPVSTTMVPMKAAQDVMISMRKQERLKSASQNSLSRFTGWCTELVPIYPNEHQERCRGRHWTSS